MRKYVEPLEKLRRKSYGSTEAREWQYAGVGEQVRSGGGGCVVRGRRQYAGYWAGDGMVGVRNPIARSGFSTTGGPVVAGIARRAVPVCHC